MRTIKTTPMLVYRIDPNAFDRAVELLKEEVQSHQNISKYHLFLKDLFVTVKAELQSERDTLKIEWADFSHTIDEVLSGMDFKVGYKYEEFAEIYQTIRKEIVDNWNTVMGDVMDIQLFEIVKQFENIN